MPTKAAFLLCLVVLEKVLTVDKLKSRGMQMPNRCYMCGCNEETALHLFLHCPVSHNLWSFIMNRFNKCWPLPASMSDLVVMWDEENISGLSDKGRIPWRCSPIVLCWFIWMERNARCFDRKGITNSKLLESALSLLFSWTTHWFKGLKFHDLMFD